MYLGLLANSDSVRGEGQERLIIFTLTLAYVTLVILENQLTWRNITADLLQRKTNSKLIDHEYMCILCSSLLAQYL